MKDEYIIINKSQIEKKIERLEKRSQLGLTDEEWNNERGQEESLKQLLSQSTPLIPEIEKAWEDGRNGTALVGNFPFVERRYVNKTSKDYIKNLKLDI